jgi:L-asparaginase / beta-aspartyl-peptidase
MHTHFHGKAPLLAIHGGAGDLRPEGFSPAQRLVYESALQRVIEAVFPELRAGCSALEAAVEAVRLLEDEPLFNAGRGAVFTAEGHHEMDAAVMCGQSGQAGAVAGVRLLKNPVLTATKVLEQENFVLLSGSGAEEFAREHGQIFEPAAYFHTPERMAQLEKARMPNTMALDHHKFGTVGAVAIDRNHHSAAATSTGGLTNKRYGRIGDSPIIGAGTFAGDSTCAVSCTGYGEPFLLRNAAYQVAARMKFGRANLSEAVRATVHEDLPRFQGDGGLIAVAPTGELCLSFNSAMMYRAWAAADIAPRWAIS